MNPFSIPVAAVVQDAAADKTIWDALQAGGPLMVPIALCSILVVALTFERFLRLRRAQLVPAELDDLLGLVRRGELATAADRCGEIGGPAARILGAGLRRVGYPLHDVERAMEDQAVKEQVRLKAPIRPIVVIAGVAPLLGLLGTVVGIQEAFAAVVTAGMEAEYLAGGIEKALTTTIAGLAVAIPASLLAAWLASRVRRIVAEIDERLAPTAEAIAARPETRHAA